MPTSKAESSVERTQGWFLAGAAAVITVLGLVGDE